MISEFMNLMDEFIRTGVRGKISGYNKDIMAFLSQTGRLFMEDSLRATENIFDRDIGNEKDFHFSLS
jgi:hypothetical protein